MSIWVFCSLFFEVVYYNTKIFQSLFPHSIHTYTHTHTHIYIYIYMKTIDAKKSDMQKIVSERWINKVLVWYEAEHYKNKKNDYFAHTHTHTHTYIYICIFWQWLKCHKINQQINHFNVSQFWWFIPIR